MRTRRISLIVGLAVIMSFFLSACNKPAEERKLTIFIWSEYIDPDVITDFEKTRGVKVQMDFYESNEEMISALQTGRQGNYDIIVPTTYYLPALISLNLIQPLNKSLLPNIGNVDPFFANVDEDPGNLYTVPYQWGTSGLVVRGSNPEEFEDSWSLLFDPEVNKGNFILFDTARDVIGGALLYLGYSVNTTDPAQIKEAGDLLIATKNRPTFLSFNNGVDGLANVIGRVATIAQAYNGEAVKAAMEDPEIRYLIPREGCEIWLDVFAIPAASTNVETAHEFLNYLLEPKVAARMSSYSKYATPNARALEFIPKEDLENPGIYPPVEMREKMQYYKDLGGAGRLYEETWTFVKSQ
ncbi:MAG: spermidine/putrescine ABC transporter substrate-binding protein [Deltaproteobacteria bacterium]|nr:spermidine/putrescine ABC transporter substrate-binding protein [Deltaproteobacteria bacterium]